MKDEHNGKHVLGESGKQHPYTHTLKLYKYHQHFRHILYNDYHLAPSLPHVLSPLYFFHHCPQKNTSFVVSSAFSYLRKIRTARLTFFINQGHLISSLSPHFLIPRRQGKKSPHSGFHSPHNKFPSIYMLTMMAL